MPDSIDTFLDLGRSLGGIFLVVFYAAIVLWTYKDARRRIDDPILVATAVAASMLPIVGVLVYMMLRPPEYLADVRERELEIRAMERTLGRQERCPYCKSHIEGDYLSCPVCMTKLRHECIGCEKPLDPRWVMCPFCETEVPRSNRANTDAPKPGRSKPMRPKPTARRKAPAARPEADTKPRATTKSSSKSDSKSDTKSTPSIDTEPFNSGGRRFVRSSEKPLSEQPTMVGPKSTDPV
jgi:hypothetical protein